MTMHSEYPVAVPCWVETFQIDPRAALEFYGPMFGWEFSEGQPMAGGLAGDYFAAQLHGRDLAGIGTLPSDGPPTAVWSTSIRVDSVDRAIEHVIRIGGARLIGPLTHPRGGRWAVLADRTAAAFGVWESGDRGGAQLLNVPGTWAMSTLHTPDPDDATAFYAAAFGWESEPIAPGSPVNLCRLPGYVGEEPAQPIPRDVVAVMTATEQEPVGPPVPPHWNVNFAVDDVDAIAARAADHGGNVIIGPVDTPGFRSAVLIDPQGAAFSVSHPAPTP